MAVGRRTAGLRAYACVDLGLTYGASLLNTREPDQRFLTMMVQLATASLAGFVLVDLASRSHTMVGAAGGAEQRDGGVAFVSVPLPSEYGLTVVGRVPYVGVYRRDATVGSRSAVKRQRPPRGGL